MRQGATKFRDLFTKLADDAATMDNDIVKQANALRRGLSAALDLTFEKPNAGTRTDITRSCQGDESILVDAMGRATFVIKTVIEVTDRRFFEIPAPMTLSVEVSLRKAGEPWVAAIGSQEPLDAIEKVQELAAQVSEAFREQVRAFAFQAIRRGPPGASGPAYTGF